MRRGALLVAALLLLARAAVAHPLEPGLLALEEQGGGHFAARFRAPRAAPDARPIWPAACRALGGVAPGGAIDLDCGTASLAGAAVGVADLAPGAEVVARVRFADGRTSVSWLRGGDASLEIPARASAVALFADHVALGAAHLVGGIDHLLFLVGLAALLARDRRLWLAITAFTAGHSATLACAVLGAVRLPAAAIEPAIAVTLIWLAYELARRAEGGDAGGVARWPLILPFAFGLLHGLGFARALDWLGVARADLPVALAGFNAGIEIAQLACLAALLPALRLLATNARRTALACAYGVGTLGVYWLLDRIAAGATGL
jgi:hypothetical protein